MEEPKMLKEIMVNAWKIQEAIGMISKPAGRSI